MSIGVHSMFIRGNFQCVCNVMDEPDKKFPALSYIINIRYGGEDAMGSAIHRFIFAKGT